LLKTRKRWVSLLTAVVMIAALLVPFAGTASAVTTYNVNTTPSVQADGSLAQQPGNFLQISADTVQASLANDSELFLDVQSSPSGFGIALGTPVFSGIFTSGADSGFGVTAVVYVTTTSAATVVQGQNVYKGYKLRVETAGAALTGSYPANSTISIPITYLVVPGGVSGSVNLNASSPGGLFSSGTVPIATAGTGAVTLAAESVETVTDSGGTVGTIDITESLAGALANSGSTAALKLTLPSGFTWTGVGTPQVVWGTFLGGATPFNTPLNASANANLINFSTSNNDRALNISVGPAAISTARAFIKLTPTIAVDPSIAKLGDVVVTVGGAADGSPSTLTVAKYGTFELGVKEVGEVPAVTAGKAVELGKFQITEGVAGSLVNNRTIKLSLPSNVYWVEGSMPEIDNSLSTKGGVGNIAFDRVGSSGNEISATVPYTANSTAAILVFKNAEVTTPVSFTGPIEVTVSGTQGITGTLTLANVASAVSVTAGSPVNVQIGTAGVKVADYTITEAAAGNLESTITWSAQDTTTGQVETTSLNTTAFVKLTLPTGVNFTVAPTVTVTAGDLQIGTVSTGTGFAQFNIKSTSTVASTITVSNIQLTIDRTVPEGTVKISVKGPAVDQNLNNSQTAVIYPNNTSAASAVVANVATGPSGQLTGKAVFKIGEASYTLNGETVAIDVAPFISDSRTFLPVRFIANALGVNDANIMWDEATRKVTIISGDRVVQLTIGSKVLLLNGAAITMDVAPMITNDRTVLPVRWVAQALGAEITWDATEQTVTIDF
jgi:hypothetical protein